MEMSVWSNQAARATFSMVTMRLSGIRRPKWTRCSTMANRLILGGAVLTAHKTAGHTRGCTTWSLRVSEAGKSYDVVIVGSPNVNPGYKLVNNASYPQIADDYARGFQVLKSLPCDVFLGAHGGYYGMETKYPRLNAGGANPYIDPAGYKNYVADREQAFLSELQKQTAAAKKQ